MHIYYYLKKSFIENTEPQLLAVFSYSCLNFITPPTLMSLICTFVMDVVVHVNNTEYAKCMFRDVTELNDASRIADKNTLLHWIQSSSLA